MRSAERGARERDSLGAGLLLKFLDTTRHHHVQRVRYDECTWASRDVTCDDVECSLLLILFIPRVHPEPPFEISREISSLRNSGILIDRTGQSLIILIILIIATICIHAPNMLPANMRTRGRVACIDTLEES